ncbi:Calcium-binding protein PBP1 [Linum perenne]
MNEEMVFYTRRRGQLLAFHRRQPAEFEVHEVDSDPIPPPLSHLQSEALEIGFLPSQLYCNRFAGKERGVITPASLGRNATVLCLQDLSEGEIARMVSEGDLDDDGALNQMEFCVLMFRLSPNLMSESRAWVEEALEDEFRDVAGF